ncbi:leucine-rich repeat-containing protein 38 [Anolis sagrei]|uniref:leucine-rich repeat-containing protein 38 n=1 Tax=Anolis sagrei TaxID=38937 RepID=UPI00351FD091
MWPCLCIWRRLARLLVLGLVFLLPVGELCPTACSCLDFHTIDCRDQGLLRVPSPFPLDVRKLLAAGNRIREIPPDFFVFYNDLVYLDFRNNAISVLEGGTFSSSAKLVYLDLSYNNLTQLDAGAFKSAEKLIKLSLGHNSLSAVDREAFQSLGQLQVLELNDNELRTLDVAALEALPNLRTIRLEGNPWLCDCDFAGLFSWLEGNPNKLQKGLDEIQCTVPVEDITIFLSELTQASFRDCKFSLSLTDLLIIIFSGVAVSIAAIVSSFVLALIVNCFQKCAPSKDDDEEDDDDD